MDIFLALAVVAVGASGLYVAATLNRRAEQTARPLIDKAVGQISGKIDTALTQQLQELRNELNRELAEREKKSSQAQYTSMAGLTLAVQRQGAQTQADVAEIQAQVDQIGGRIADIMGRLTTMEPSKTEPAPAQTPPGETTLTGVTEPSHPLARAILEAESSCERDGWGSPPQLYALVGKAKLLEDDPELQPQIGEAEEDSLIPVKQEPLPAGEPRATLAEIGWPDEVSGCVLVTELLVLPPDDESEAPADPAAVGQWAREQPGSHPARLAVGVTRDGRYTCILRLKGDDSVRLDAELADDLVTALLETFAEGRSE
jgi:hypothetical protein